MIVDHLTFQQYHLLLPLAKKKGDNEGLSGLSEVNALSLPSSTSPFRLFFGSSGFIIFSGLIGVSDSGNGVTCILLLVEKEGFIVGQDAKAVVAFVVFFSFFDGTFLFCTVDFCNLLDVFLVLAVAHADPPATLAAGVTCVETTLIPVAASMLLKMLTRLSM